MAKELPYFQFEPAEYLTKDISFCSLSAQGMFVNLCAYYWQRGCELTKSQILRRLNYEDEFNELINEGVIDLDGENVIIKFLDEQMENATKLSNKNSRNGSKGGAKVGNQNARKSQKQPKNNPDTTQKQGIREDKIIKDNKRENKIKEINVDLSGGEGDFKETLLNDIKKINYSSDEFLEDWNSQRKEHLGLPSFVNRLSNHDKDDFEDIKKDYSREDFKNAMEGLFKQTKFPNDNTSMQSSPTHFLKCFNSYLTAYHDKNYALYGKQEAVNSESSFTVNKLEKYS